MQSLTPLSNALRHFDAEADFLGDGLTAYAQELPRGRAKRHLLLVANDIRNKQVETALANESLPHREILWSVIADQAAVDSTSRFLQSILNGARNYSHNRHRTWRAFAYPTILLIICSLIMAFVALAIMPMFSELYHDFAIGLPIISRLALNSRQLFVGWFLFVAGAVLAASIVPVAIYDFVFRWIPAFNSYRRCSVVARFCRAAAVLVRADVELSAAVENAGNIPHRPLIAMSARQLARQLRTDDGMETFTPVYPLTSTVTYAFSQHVRREQRPELLLSLGDIYDARAQRLLRWLEVVMEPVLVSILGAMVGVTLVVFIAPFVSVFFNLLF